MYGNVTFWLSDKCVDNETSHLNAQHYKMDNEADHHLKIQKYNLNYCSLQTQKTDLAVMMMLTMVHCKPLQKGKLQYDEDH